MSTPALGASRAAERPASGAWRSLSRSAKGYRIAHAVWSVVALTALAYIWICAARRRRDRWLVAAVAFLSVQGVGLIVGRGNCPLGPVQRQLGDPVPLFELVLPPRAARAAIPVLTGVVAAALISLVLRPPR